MFALTRRHFGIYLIILVHIFNIADTQREFGPYQMLIYNVTECKGPRHKQCARQQQALSGGRALWMSIEVLEDTSIDMVRLYGYHMGKEKNTVPMIRLQLDKPCEQVILGHFIQMLLNTTKSCKVKKGTYISTMDVEGISQTYWGGKFYYGNFSFKSISYNNKCNLACHKLNMAITPTN